MAELEDDMTPGQAAHNSLCDLDDWDELDDETRQIWEDAAKRSADVQAEQAADQDGASG